jgi:ComF family protein
MRGRRVPPATARALLLPLLDALLPPRCLACGSACWEGAGLPLCRACRLRLPSQAPRCAACGRISGPLGPVAHCARCAGPAAEPDALSWSGAPGSRGRQALRGVVACWPYAGSARDLVRAAKFGARPAAARFLGRALCAPVAAARVPGDLVVPVPLSAVGLRRRGFNQADVMARVLARAVDIEYDRRALQRVRHDEPQSGLGRAARLTRPAGAFRARSARVAGRCILLVDDVLTTGATARACALALRRAGARAVTAAVACRAERG